MASLTRWTWISASSGRCWRTGRPGMLQSMGLQRVGHDWATEHKQELAQLCPCNCLGSNLGVQTGRAQRSVSLRHTLEARLEKGPNHLSDVAGKPQLLKKKKNSTETILFFYIILFIYPSCYFMLVRWSLSCIYCTILDIYSNDPQISTKYQSVSTTLFLDIFKDVSLKKK